jgi:acyltransferase-like protein
MTADDIPLKLWLAFWRSRQWYHRYTVEGIERLIESPPALIVGYHGRPAAFDLCMLTVALYDRLHYLPHAVIHRSVNAVPLTKWFFDGLGFVSHDGESLKTAVKRGEHLVVAPGGVQEGCRSVRERYRVHWGDHTGYLRTALKYHLRIVPVAAEGADGAYFGLNNAETCARRLGVPRDWAYLLWLGVGPLGLWPFSPPFPVRMRQLIGEPIDPGAENLRADDPDDLLRLHHRVMAAVQELLDRGRRRRSRRRR